MSYSELISLIDLEDIDEDSQKDEMEEHKFFWAARPIAGLSPPTIHTATSTSIAVPTV